MNPPATMRPQPGDPRVAPSSNRPAVPRPPDLRLVGFAVATWLSALAALHLSARTGLLLGTAAMVSALLAGWPRPPANRGGRWDPLRWLSVTVLLGVAVGGIATAVRVAVRDTAPLTALVRDGAAVEADVVVRDDPRALRGTPGLPVTYLLAVDLTAVRPDGPGAAMRLTVRAVLLANDPGWRVVLPGQRVVVSGRLLPPRGGDLSAAVMSVKDPPHLLGRPPWVQRAAGFLRAGLQRACAPLPTEIGGLLPGLVVGDTSRLEPAVEANFRTTGMTHLCAVSGANIAILLGAVLFFVRWTRAGPVLTTVICAVALVGFVVLVRPSPSVVRAAMMGAIGLLGLATGRSRAAMPALAAGVGALIVIDPELAGDAGFALSVLATSGLLLLAPGWRDALHRRGLPVAVAEAFAVPAAAQLACGPVIAGLSGTVSLVAVPANLLVAPAIAPATLLGIAATIVSPVWPTGAQLIAGVAAWPVCWLVTVADYGARVPSGAVPWPDGVVGAMLLAAASAALLIGARHAVVRRLVAVGCVATMLGALPVRLFASGWPPADWLVVACAVGQGDAIVVPVGPGRAVVVDAGPDPVLVDRCLQRLGVARVVLLVVSHFHVDHVGGIAGVFRGRRVDAVAVPDWPEPAGGRAVVSAQAAAARAPVRAVAAGWARVFEGVALTVSGPLEPLHGTRSDPNNNSLVLLIRIGGRTILLPGDAETEEQHALWERAGPGALRADILKVAHHGSAYQSPEFLRAVAPAVALVSVGADNDYGHPNAALLSRLHRDGARVLRTDLSGDLAVVRAGSGLAVVNRGDAPDR